MNFFLIICIQRRNSLTLQKESTMIRYREILGKKIRLLREIHGSTQEQLRTFLGYGSNAAISLIESGQRGMGKDKIVRTAEFYGVNPVVLLSNRDMSKEELECYVLFEKAFKNKSPLVPAVKAILEKAAEQVKPTLKPVK